MDTYTQREGQGTRAYICITARGSESEFLQCEQEFKNETDLPLPHSNKPSKLQM